MARCTVYLERKSFQSRATLDHEDGAELATSDARFVDTIDNDGVGVDAVADAEMDVVVVLFMLHGHDEDGDVEGEQWRRFLMIFDEPMGMTNVL